jgi:hypothetical protein
MLISNLSSSSWGKANHVLLQAATAQHVEPEDADAQHAQLLARLNRP